MVSEQPGLKNAKRGMLEERLLQYSARIIALAQALPDSNELIAMTVTSVVTAKSRPKKCKA